LNALLRLGAGVVLAAALTVAHGADGKAKPPAASAQKQKQLQTEQRELRERLARVKRDLARTESSHSAAASALAAAEAAISAANRRLRELAQSRTMVEAQLVALQERSRLAAGQQSDEEKRLGHLLRTQFALAQASPWHRLIDGADPNQLGRDQVYLALLARDRTEAIAALSERRAELAALEAATRERQQELADIARDEEAQRAQAVKQQAARRQALDQLARQLTTQRQSLATLERNEARLGSLLDEITQVLAEQAQRDAQRRAEREAAARRRAAPAGKNAAPKPEPRPDVARPAAAPDLDPAALQGKLQLPVRGEVVARFGSPRRSEAGVAAPTWKGVFIRAPEGSEVRAAAAGRVVFADWLRGYGNLLVLDHGDGVLSVYGNNQTLYADDGDRVAANAPIATVGTTGGNTEPGLYFEIRVKGRPVDPLRWAAAR
jgi:septal ring factor EnvC (AmiA/AmiB activator)